LGGAGRVNEVRINPLLNYEQVIWNSVGVKYSNGPLNVAATYLQLDNTGNGNTGGAVSAGPGGAATLAAQTQRTYGVGANYTFGPATFGLVWTHSQLDNVQSANIGGTYLNGMPGTNLHLDNNEVNGCYAVTPALALGCLHVHGRQDDGFKRHGFVAVAYVLAASRLFAEQAH